MDRWMGRRIITVLGAAMIGLAWQLAPAIPDCRAVEGASCMHVRRARHELPPWLGPVRLQVWLHMLLLSLLCLLGAKAAGRPFGASSCSLVVCIARGCTRCCPHVRLHVSPCQVLACVSQLKCEWAIFFLG